MDQLEYGVRIPFLQVQNALIDDTTHFDKFEKWVWVVLARHAFGGTAYPSQKTIAEKVGISDRKVRDCLVNLQAKGWLQKSGIHPDKQTVIWRVIVPEQIEIEWMEKEIERKKNKIALFEQPKTPESKTDEKPKKIPYQEIIEYLNEKTDKKFKCTTAATQKAINGRWAEGNRIDDFKHVIDVKVDDWLGTEWEKHLCPETLFRPGNFEKYLNQKRKGGNNGKANNAAQLARANHLPF